MPTSPTPETHITAESPVASLAKPSHEALLEQLDVALRRFDPLCVAPPGIRNEKALWFHPHELTVVNQTWETKGIEGVISAWGAERTFASGNPVSLTQKPSALSPEAPDNAIVLLVCEFGANAEPNPAQVDYFRSCHFKTPEALTSEIVGTLSELGLLTELIPEVDTATLVTLRGAPITDVRCSAEWYGPHNIYGDGSVVIISLQVSPPKEEAETVQLRFERDGNLQRLLWCASLSETGYEGHDGASFTLTPEALRAFLPILSKIAEAPPLTSTNDKFGFWYGNLLAPLPESALL